MLSQSPKGSTTTEVQRRRLDAEWLFLNAAREVIHIASRALKPPTYDDTIQAAVKLAPVLFDEQTSLLLREYENIYAREFLQKAAALSQLNGTRVSPIALIDRELAELNTLLATAKETDGLRRRIKNLRGARDSLTKKRLTEDKLITWDAVRLKRELPITEYGADYQEYALPDGRAIRIRALHPDPTEHLTGADVIYEYYWEAAQKVRLAVIQYKIWDGEKLAIPLSKWERIDKQLKRMDAAFCGMGTCQVDADEQQDSPYRMPCCTAFLRPTDQLLNVNSKLASSAYHVPLCKLNQMWHENDNGTHILFARDVAQVGITTQTFDELFNNNMLGSKWLNYEQLEDMYREYKILQSDERIVLHIQDVEL